MSRRQVSFGMHRLHAGLLCTAALLVVAGCGRPSSSAQGAPPASTPLPTKERTVGRVQQGLQQADEDAAKRREQLDRAVDAPPR